MTAAGQKAGGIVRIVVRNAAQRADVKGGSAQKPGVLLRRRR